MSGNITVNDVNVMLKQNEAMRKKIVLIQDYKGNNQPLFYPLRVPILTYSTKKKDDKVCVIGIEDWK